jgi:hypothetical protein
MNKHEAVILYLGSRAIVRYIDKHPVIWPSGELAWRNGIGDRAGVPPTPAVYEFFSLVIQKQGLFTQSEYRDYCFEQWKTWDSLTNASMREGVEAKLYRNFYPALVATLHAWSLLVEVGWFDRCVIDPQTDAISKHDIIVSRSGEAPIALDLFIGTSRAIADRRYKTTHRKAPIETVKRSFEVPLSTEDRPKKKPGNMRWYCLKDFEHVYAAMYNQDSLWNIPIVPCTCGYHLSKKGRVYERNLCSV